MWPILALFFGGSNPPACAQRPPDEKVVVTANAHPVPFDNLARTVAVLGRDDIRNLPVRSVVDALEYLAPVDIHARSPFGMQADVSVRGSNFSQVLILVDGIRINDSQTSHHNADLPLQLHDIERIEVLFGQGSSIYGADAFGGIVNIITRRQTKGAGASISVGQFGLLEGSFALGFQKGRLEQSVSASANRSSGFQYDREFRSIWFSSRTRIGDRATVSVWHVNKKFGANGFYGPAPSKEGTDQTLISVEQLHRETPGRNSSVQWYYRTHGDRFLYDIRMHDGFESRHRTHAAGMLVRTRQALDNSLSLTLGGEAGADWIDSSNLGHHAFGRMSAFGEIQWGFGQSVVVYPGLRLDYYSSVGTAISPSVSVGWWVQPRIRLRSSLGHAFRIPVFTELYYRDPNHEASVSLKPETAWSVEFGTDFVPARNWLAAATLFSRRERNAIDWVRVSESEKWRTANIRRLHTEGIELSLERTLHERARLGLQYSRLSRDAGRIDYMSKYVLDYARDSWTSSVSVSLPFSLEYKQGVNYRRRADGRSYWLIDGRLERRFRGFAAAVDATNLLNSRYQEIAGVDMPGRWFVFTLSR